METFVFKSVNFRFLRCCLFRFYHFIMFRFGFVLTSFGVIFKVFFSPHAGSNLYGERFRTSRIGIILQHNSLTHSHVAITVSTTTYTSTHSYLNWRHLLYSWFCLESSYYFHLFIHISLNFSLTSPVCLTNEVLWVWPLTDWLGCQGVWLVISLPWDVQSWLFFVNLTIFPPQ